MAIEVTEVAESRRWEGSREAGDVTSSRTFHVRDTDQDQTLSRAQVIGAAGIPQRGDAHPDDPRFIVVGEPRLSPARDAVNGHEVLIEYVPAPRAVGIDRDIAEPFFDPISGDVEAIFVDTWRLEAKIPTAAAYPDRQTDSGDVSGFPIDSLGEPESVPVTVQVADITQVVEGVPPIGLYRAFANKRNRDSFLGAEPGHLLYKGANYRKVTTATWEVTHRFAWDEWRHFRQIVKLDPEDGKPALNASVYTVDDTEQGLSETYSEGTIGFPVWWVQPYPRIRVFRQLGLRLEV